MRIMPTKQNQGQAEQVTENPRRRTGGSNQPKLTRRRQIRGEDPGGQPVAL